MATKLQHTVTINRPIEEVFEFVTKPENMPTWANAVKEAVQTSDGAVSIGTTCYVRSKAMGMEVEQNFVVTECEPNRRYSARTTSGPFPMVTSYTFEEADGGTKVFVESEADLGGFVKMAGPIINRMGRKRLESDHENLKKLLESGA